MKRHTQIVPLAAFTGLIVAGISTSVSAQQLGPVHRFSAEFQFQPSLGVDEITTTAPPAANGSGGTVVYSKTLFVPGHTLFVTISATGDAHTRSPGSGVSSVTSLLMTCTVNGVLCQSGSGLATAGPSGWITLLKLPPPATTSSITAGTATEGCNGGAGDGGGGPADCHDNNFSYTWCTPIMPGVQSVQLKLASSPGGDSNNVFYERAHIYIDATPNGQAPDACVPAARGPFTADLP